MQLPLPVTLPTDETFDSFIYGDNGAVVNLLISLSEQGAQWRNATALSALSKSRLPGVAITGGAGRGKSHLLYAFCHQLANKNIRHIYLNMENIPAWSPAILDGLECLPFICLDNIHVIAGHREWEEAVFHFINRIVDNQGAMLLWTSQFGAHHPAFLLPDLRSRLSWGMTFQLHPLDENAKTQVLKNRAAQRGLKFSEQAIQFLLHHSDRDLPALLSLLDRLDTRSLQEQKKLSVGMVKRELGFDVPKTAGVDEPKS
ncbi:DnaA regulatory inactivator Hda [Alteromonas sp. C1M14]|uniref:DnaA regulatory inactivator Hda n=1 Tax=Alteromonas sp. C1M14 TaxID=2841567 RepID=UPI001C0881B8|nr:DnaA regulatory inactivator Hda [Alteromonas sp. C1M14]MBU2976786.1 DnaA regulatory inactivator Hda [Alteromonas sp. C1M14]